MSIFRLTFLTILLSAFSQTNSLSSPITKLDTLDVQIITTDVLCKGDSTGSIEVVPQNGIHPYSYLWSTSDTTAVVDSLPSGEYAVTVTDSIGCMLVDSVFVSEPSDLNVNFSVLSEPFIQGDEYRVGSFPDGGIAPYSFIWNNGSIAWNTFLEPGWAGVTVTDANGCSATHERYLEPIPCAIEAVVSATDVSCHGGSDGVLYGSYSGANGQPLMCWSGFNCGASNQYNVPAGHYSLYVDDGFCHNSTSIEVKEPEDVIDAIANQTQDISCINETTGIEITTSEGVTAPYTFLWEDGYTEPSRDSLYEGTYLITVTDNNCNEVITVEIEDHLHVNVSTDIILEADCFIPNPTDTIFTIIEDILSDVIYEWITQDGNIIEQNTDFSAIIDTAGIYTLIVTDTLTGCSISETLNVDYIDNSEGPNLEIDSIFYFCYEGSPFILKPEFDDGHTIEWFNEQDSFLTNHNIINIQEPSNYHLVVTDPENGCTNSAMIDVLQNPAIISNPEITLLQTSGANGMINPNISGGTSPYKFEWNTGAETEIVEDLETGDYTLVVKDGAGCFKVFHYTVDKTTDLSEIEGLSYRIYPNPTVDFIFIELESKENYNSEYIYEIINSVNQIIKKGNLENTVQTHIINCQSIPNGFYSLNILNEDKLVAQQKIVIQH